MGATQWHEYWATGGAGARALAAPAQREFLSQHWRQFFAQYLFPAAIIIDMACGDGAIFAFLREEILQGALGATFLAVDSSFAAVRAAMCALPGVVGIVSDSRRVPVETGSADIVVSQFGLEYGGAAAFQESARVLKPGGVMSAVCHLKAGTISAECSENLRLLNIFFNEGVATHARASLACTYASRYAPTGPERARADKKFQQASQRLATALDAAPTSTAKATLTSAMHEINELSARRMVYDSTEALAFVDEVKLSLSSYRDRMRSMLGAALDHSGIDRIAETIASAGMSNITVAPVAFQANSPLSAWRIQAHR